MEYFKNLFRKAAQSFVISTVLIVFLWGTLYYLTDFSTIADYFFIGLLVCVLNTLISNLSKPKKNVLYVQSSWIIMAGAVLVLYHTGFDAAAVLLAAAIFVSPFFWASLAEGIVGLSLLITLAWMMP